MGRLLLVGDDGSGSAAGLGTEACIARTKRFRNALIKAGLEVVLCSPVEGKKGAAEVKQITGRNRFDCIVAISPFPAESAVMSGSSLPMWIDMNGMHPAELQLQSRLDPRYGERMLRILSLENILLMRGDSFSTPSLRQTSAITGELLILGRTNFDRGRGISVEAVPHSANGFNRSSMTDGGLFNVISTGSFNIWFDELTLFRALEIAMSRNPSITFTSTGGSIPFSPHKYSHFKSLVERSEFRDRFFLKGWVSREELEDVYCSASAAIFTDINSPETLLGARTRTLDWICRGIPVICTRGAEVSYDIERYNLGSVVSQESPEELGEAILSLAADSTIRERIIGSQERWCRTDGSSEKVFQSVVRWCSNPVTAEDRPLGRSTVPSMNSLPYLAMLFKELSGRAGTGYALKRVFRRINPFRFFF